MISDLRSDLIFLTRPTQWIRDRLKQKMSRCGLVESYQFFPQGQLHYWIGGTGRPLVLLHGFGATALWQWHPQVDDFCKHHRLIIPNLFGFGESIPHSSERSLEFQGEMIIKLLDSLGVEQFDLLGMSYGGFVANRIAVNWSERVDRLIFVSSPGGVMTTADYQYILDAYQIEHITDLLLPTEPAGVKRLIQLAWYKKLWVPKYILRDAHKTLFSIQLEIKRELLNALLDYLDKDPTLNHDISHIPLLIWGEFDPLFPLELAERVRASLNTSLHLLHKTAHAPNLGRAAEFNRLVLRFLQR